MNGVGGDFKAEMGSPEVPSNSSDDVHQPPVNEGLIFVDSDSDEEEAFHDNDGYILLSQNAVDLQSEVMDDGSDSSGSEEYLDAECEGLPAVTPQEEVSVQGSVNSGSASSADSSSNHNESNFDEGTTAELRELWSAPATRVDFDLGVDKVQAVQEAMSGVTLPASAIPEWAASVPEDQWRQQIMDRIQELKAVK